MKETNSPVKFGKKGFTLIELVIAILVFTVSIAGVAKMQSEAVKGNGFSMQMTDAINVAQNQAEFLRGLNLTDANLSVGNHAGAGQTVRGINYNLNWTVAQLAGGLTGVQVTVTAAWAEKNRNPSLSMSFIRSNVL